jgi:hypothetical protein
MDTSKELLFEEVKSVLSDSQLLILYALDPHIQMFDPQEELFHSVRILTQVQVTDGGAQAELADALT